MPNWTLHRTKMVVLHPLTSMLPVNRCYSAFCASETLSWGALGLIPDVILYLELDCTVVIRGSWKGRQKDIYIRFHTNCPSISQKLRGTNFEDDSVHCLWKTFYWICCNKTVVL